jgi:2,4-dienoyl-CoA reductase-like NADH-dependent reductase (Old Yellow Enzyme family)
MAHRLAYQAHFAEAVKREHGDKILVGTVGGINTGEVANGVLESGQADMTYVIGQKSRIFAYRMHS